MKLAMMQFLLTLVSLLDRAGEPDRCKTRADDFSRVLKKRLHRIFDAMGRKDHLAAADIKRPMRRNGIGSSTARLRGRPRLETYLTTPWSLKREMWEIDFPESSEP